MQSWHLEVQWPMFVSDRVGAVSDTRRPLREQWSRSDFSGCSLLLLWLGVVCCFKRDQLCTFTLDTTHCALCSFKRDQLPAKTLLTATCASSSNKMWRSQTSDVIWLQIEKISWHCWEEMIKGWRAQFAAAAPDLQMSIVGPTKHPIGHFVKTPFCTKPTFRLQKGFSIYPSHSLTQVRLLKLKESHFVRIKMFILYF